MYKSLDSELAPLYITEVPVSTQASGDLSSYQAFLDSNGHVVVQASDSEESAVIVVGGAYVDGG